MLIYEKKNNEIIKLEKNEFESEKDLQNFVEKNMEKLFSIKFIKSELINIGLILLDLIKMKIEIHL